MKAYGAELILTDGSLGMKGSIEKMNKLLSENSNYITGQVIHVDGGMAM